MENGICFKMTERRDETMAVMNNQVEIVENREDDIDEDFQNRFIYENPQQQSSVLNNMNTLRKNGEFCDISLTVEEHGLYAHRAVLAVVSPFLFELLSRDDGGNQGGGRHQLKVKDIDYSSFEHLLNYAYTARLEIKQSEVQGVYKAALRLRMSSVVEACAQHLADNLTSADCLSVCSLAFSDEFLREKTHTYVQEHIDEVLNCQKFYSLPRIQLNIISDDKDQIDTMSEDELSRMILTWVREKMSDANVFDSATFTDHAYVLYLNGENRLTDCQDLDDESDLTQADIIHEYKRQISNKKANGSKSRDSNSGSSSPSTSVKIFTILPEEVEAAIREWHVVSILRTADQIYTAIAFLGGTLAAVIVHLNYMSPPSGVASPDIQEVVKTSAEAQRLTGIGTVAGQNADVPLKWMSCARASLGIASFGDKLVVCGGYDRVDCMDTVESFSFENNEWSPLPSMLNRRGRFDLSAFDGKLYACGGSNGVTELKSVECYNPVENKWKEVGQLTTARCSTGVAVFSGQLYCIGGSTGIAALDRCEVYSPAENKWSKILHLQTGRSQAAVFAYKGHMFAIGGTDGWSCLTSVEVFNSQTNVWSYVSPLNTPRRGAGISVINDKLIVIGGNDGTQSLSSTEIYDSQKDSWYYGPSLCIPRANVGVTRHGDRLVAAGGFSGKRFLNSIEYLDSLEGDWRMTVPSMINRPCNKRTVIVRGSTSDMAACVSNNNENINGHFESNDCGSCFSDHKENIKYC